MNAGEYDAATAALNRSLAGSGIDPEVVNEIMVHRRNINWMKALPPLLNQGGAGLEFHQVSTQPGSYFAIRDRFLTRIRRFPPVVAGWRSANLGSRQKNRPIPHNL